MAYCGLGPLLQVAGDGKPLPVPVNSEFDVLYGRTGTGRDGMERTSDVTAGRD